MLLGLLEPPDQLGREVQLGLQERPPTTLERREPLVLQVQPVPVVNAETLGRQEFPGSQVYLVITEPQEAKDLWVLPGRLASVVVQEHPDWLDHRDLLELLVILGRLVALGILGLLACPAILGTLAQLGLKVTWVCRE